MGIADWDITSGGDAAMTHDAFQHTNVPVDQLSHDVWARRIDNVGGTGFGRMQFLYGTGAPSYADFGISKDVSVRSAMCLGLRNSGHALALGARMSAGISSDLTDNKLLSEDGYQLRLFENGTDWRMALYRVNSGGEVQLGSTIDLATGVLGDYKWFHLRLDFLLQPNGDATIQAFTNDIGVNPINPANVPTWGAVWVKVIDEDELAVSVPAYDRVGWGGQVDPGAGAIYEGYMDWTECWHS